MITWYDTCMVTDLPTARVTGENGKSRWSNSSSIALSSHVGATLSSGGWGAERQPGTVTAL